MASYDKEQLFTYDGRLATFKKTTKKRGSTASGRGKALNWPHKQITPADLAKAGFWYNPSPDSPDNVECFLCEKSLDGWEAGDDPLTEHITHASHCGWAVLSAIESEFDDYATRNPTGEQLVEARLATFADRWPHEEKKGWMCKVDRLVEAGWMYTPTSDSDDMATCVYCQLALDGWEPSDEPYDEHYKRSPNCAFFLLGGVSQPTKKTARGKSSRSSKASQVARLSTQSNTATTADITVADTTANPEDSVISTASTMTTTSKKGRPKKGAAKGGKKKAAKKEEPPAVEEPVEPEPAPEPEPEQEAEEVVEAPPPAKSTRGKKRGSAAVEDSIVSTIEAPAPKRKKRATKTRESKVAETSIATEDTVMTEAPSTRKASGTKKARASSQTRKASVSSRAASFMRSATPEEFPDDDEIERQLEADLERQLTEDELAYTPAPVKDTKPTKNKISSDYDMFNPEPVEADEDEVDDELQLLQAQMEMEEPQLKVAKKGRKAGTRKASKQTQPKRQKAPSPPSVTEESEIESQADASEDEDHNASLGSTSTVVKKAGSVRESNASRGRPRARQPSATSDEEDSIEIVDYAEAKVETEEEEEEEEEEETERRQSTPKAAQLAAQLISSSPAPVETEEEEEDEPEEEEEEETAVPTSDFEVAEDDAESSPIRSALNSLAEPPSTPGSFISPSASARQAALSPSQSPQSSDAENQPPSSVPTVKAKRTVLAPLAVTPSKMSPSKRNVIAGLQSSKPWSAANLDAIFGTPKAGANKENGVEKLLKQGKELTSPEKQMTVEQWIKFNADEAEKRLKHECERMVSRFESEGSRAMQVLEGLETE